MKMMLTLLESHLQEQVSGLGHISLSSFQLIFSQILLLEGCQIVHDAAGAEVRCCLVNSGLPEGQSQFENKSVLYLSGAMVINDGHSDLHNGKCIGVGLGT